jgi:SAM-dependent methyltransferase
MTTFNYSDLISQLQPLQQKPAPFTPGEPLFWDDPYISQQMLAAHLSPNTDAASRKPEKIDQIIAHLGSVLGWQPGDRVLDMGCGPGLYTSRLAAQGLRVSGVDYSHRSIDYATEYARQHNLDIDYHWLNYLELTDAGLYDTVLLIYGDFCPLSPAQRSQLLGNVRRALKPGGKFVFDVTTRETRKKNWTVNKWYVGEGGFWSPNRCLILNEGFDYPDQYIFLDQFIVIEEDGRVKVYRNWFQDYDLPMITAELEQSGFKVLHAWGGLAGEALTPQSEWIGLVTEPV